MNRLLETGHGVRVPVHSIAIAGPIMSVGPLPTPVLFRTLRKQPWDIRGSTKGVP